MTRQLSTSALLLTGLILAGCSSSKPKSEEVMFWDLPQPVQKTFGQRFPRAKMESVERLTWKDGVTWYRLNFTYQGASRHVMLTSEGETPEAR